MNSHFALQVFIEETDELLVLIGASLFIDKQNETHNSINIDDVFRAVHTIKGSSALFGFHTWVDYCHQLEEILQKVKDDLLANDLALFTLLVDAHGYLQTQLLALREGKEPVNDAIYKKQFAKLTSFTDNSAATTSAPNSLELTHLSYMPPLQSERVFMKIEARKLDGLIALFDELVTSTAMAKKQLYDRQFDVFTDNFESLLVLLDQMRESALSLRMVPVVDSFRRLQHVVLELSKSLGKDVNLIIKGADTELDKWMLDKLADPLLHLMRNALDHGIEHKEIRLKKGKSAQGSITLSAAYESGSVLIRLSDDGAGIDKEKVLATAIERNLIASDAMLSEHDLYQLLFSSGFSTASQVSNVSGRGVGLDVVKRTIDELRGQIFITSEKDKGCTFEMRLPLTLSIIDGFLCTVLGLTLVLPYAVVHECLEYDSAKLVMHEGMLHFRGETITLIDMAEVLQLPHKSAERQNIIIIKYGQSKVGLIVNSLEGMLYAVIKPLHPLLQSLKTISGTTLLSDGGVGFVLDVSMLVTMAARFEKAQLEKIQQREG